MEEFCLSGKENTLFAEGVYSQSYSTGVKSVFDEAGKQKNPLGAAPPNWIIHIDMDAFFASAEQLDDPSLRGKPVVVGQGARGVVSAASYEARAFGIRSAMPVGLARRLCPHAVFVPGRRRRYLELSQAVMAALGNFSPMVEPASIDEAYMDASGLERLFGPIENLGMGIKAAVREATGGMTCSVGAAPVKFLAKIASDINKPDGLFVLYPEHMPAFLDTLAVGKIPGVGAQFLKQLEQIGVRTAGQVGRYPQEFWERRFGKAGMSLWARAQGLDSRKVEPLSAPKSESAEHTYAEDTRDMVVLRRSLMQHAERVGTSLRAQGLAGRTVTLKVKFADFTQITRSRTLPQSTNATQTIFDVACELLDAVALKLKVRLIGLGVSGFRQGAEQGMLPLGGMGASPAAAPLLNAADEEKRRKLDSALDALRGKFGRAAVVRGRLFEK